MSLAGDKLLKFLKNNPRYSYNAPTLQKETGVNVNTIRSELRRLAEKGYVLRETHGFYRVKLDSETLYIIENPPTLLHGIMISSEPVRKLQNGIHGIPATNCNIFDDLERFGFELRGNNKFVKKIYYHNDVDRLITITYHVDVRLDVYLNCSNHPVNYFEFRDILSYVDGKVDFLGPFRNQRVVEFGEAKDFREVRMSGCSEISVRVFMDHWYRVYNKESLGVTRMEQHVRCDVPVDVLLGLFERVFLPVGNGFVKEDERRDVV